MHALQVWTVRTSDGRRVLEISGAYSRADLVALAAAVERRLAELDLGYPLCEAALLPDPPGCDER